MDTRRFLIAIAIGCASAGPAYAQDPPATNSSSSPNGFISFVSDVGRDYWNFVSSPENARFAAGGLALTGTVHFGDHHLEEDTAVVSTTTHNTLKPGATYCNLAFQIPLGLTWWIVGHVAGSSRGASAGRDLVRAQISAATITYAIKYAVDRQRPNGDPRSFPSGHASASFATATVLQEHYGWKLGLPAFALATYVAGERVTEKKHWASDVTFGAVLGVMSGRTVTLHVRRQRLLVEPHAVPGGAGVIVHVVH